MITFGKVYVSDDTKKESRKIWEEVLNMTYEQIVEMVRKVFENADARTVYEHVAIQVNVIGEGAGAFYFEVADRQCCIEPYDYYDRDGLMTADAKVLKDLCEGKISMRSCIESGKIRYEGDVRKLELCLGNIKLPEFKKYIRGTRK